MKLFILLTTFFTFTVFYGHSQPGNPGGGGTPVPITGIEYLIGLGGLYGVKKLLGRSKKKTIG